MEFGKRCKNFTEQDKMILMEVAREFVSIIDNKKTDGPSVDAKKRAWQALTNKYNAKSYTGFRTEKQLHALYDNLKKKARKNNSDDKTEKYKTGGDSFICKTTPDDEDAMALETPQFQLLNNEYDSSASYHSTEKPVATEINVLPAYLQGTYEDTEVEDDHNIIVTVDAEPTPNVMKRELSPTSKESTPKMRCLTETKKRSINHISSSIIRTKSQKQRNNDDLTRKKLEILEIQHQQELMKLHKTRELLELDIVLKKVLLESAKLDLEFKRKNCNK
ncbi:uncharacterized protein LOC142976077 [Anticarsia gemmatalis]|uniref:uncharacterized protein LOC142976077 n=1 Tax=Anticarsia gemmatalis TaxID=129554 RepID=UPI003F7703E7